MVLDHAGASLTWPVASAIRDSRRFSDWAGKPAPWSSSRHPAAGRGDRSGTRTWRRWRRPSWTPSVPDRCVWGSDWPCLATAQTVDYRRVLEWLGTVVPDGAIWDRVLREDRVGLFGFSSP